MIQQALARLLEGHDLSRNEARRTMAVIMAGEATDAQIAGFLVALRAKGETADEITGCAEAMREHVLRVRPAGPACHTGSRSCFAPWLWRRVVERAKERPEGSYVARLLDQGLSAAARKVGEEGVEAALAGQAESDQRLVEEVADLWFHSYVLLAARGLDPDDVETELRRRAR